MTAGSADYVKQCDVLAEAAAIVINALVAAIASSDDYSPDEAEMIADELIADQRIQMSRERR